MDSSDYIQIRNSLIILTRVLPHFPIILSFAQAIEKRVENIRNEEKEKRPDIYALATGYSGQLKLKKSTFIPESEFHLKDNKRGQQTSQQNVTNNKSELLNSKKETKIEAVANSTPPNRSPAQVSKERSKEKSTKNSESNEADKKKEARNDTKGESRSKKNEKEEKLSLLVSKVDQRASPRRNAEHRNKDEVDHDKGLLIFINFC